MFDDQDRAVLHDIVTTGVDPLWCCEEPGLRFAAKVDAEPEKFAAELLALVDGGADLGSLLEKVMASGLDVEAWPELGSALIRRRPTDAALIGDEWLHETIGNTALLRVPADVIVLGLRDSGEWAWAAARARYAEWSEATVERWVAIAELLAADGHLFVGPPLDELDWAAQDPYPTGPDFVNERGKPKAMSSEMWKSIPHRTMFPSSDERVRRAIAEADALEAAIRHCRANEPDIGSWLPKLGDCIPGCGTDDCCRPGLFEVELTSRGHRHWAWPTLPDRLTPR
jgi:hypothetical protein